MEHNRRNKESSLYLTTLPQENICKRQFPLLTTVQKLHERNVKVASMCKKNLQHSASAYELAKSQFIKETLKDYEMHVANAAEASKERKKLLQEKRKQTDKRREQNLSKFERIMAQKKTEVALKEKKLMERSELLRQEFLKSLNNSFHRSEDKLQHIKERSKRQFNRSSVLFSQHKNKVDAANDRKKNYISELKDYFRERNQQVSMVQEGWSQKIKAVEEGYIQQLVSKLAKAEKGQNQRNTKKNKELAEKRREDYKIQERYLKKKCMLQENRQKKRQQQARKSEEKIAKALEYKTAKLTAITNTIENKRKQKQVQVKQAKISNWRQQEAKVLYLNEKHQHSSDMLHAYRYELERLHRDNLADSFVASRD